jgi:hypothetical protein
MTNKETKQQPTDRATNQPINEQKNIIPSKNKETWNEALLYACK